MVSFLNQNSLPRGLRNNNPGNLVYTGINWVGKIPYAQNSDWSGSPSNIVKQFEQFTSANYGIRAMALDVLNDLKQHNYTLAQLIYEYAPAHENNTVAYIQFVSNATGIEPNQVIYANATILKALLRSIINMENGTQAGEMITDQEIEKSILLLPELWLQQLDDFVSENKLSLGAVAATGLVIGGAIYWYKNRAA